MNTEPKLGWAALSRSALNRAEAELVADAEGMRDEVGVLALHTGYANRFFPGTSVQQTRLRYVLFVPWQVHALLAESPRAKDPRKALATYELALARRLPDGEGEGTIGRIRARQGRQVSIPPSESYWVALTHWGILAQSPPIRPAATRAEMFDRWLRWPYANRAGETQADDDKRPLNPTVRLFHSSLPPPPAEFVNGGKLGFKLSVTERDFLRKRLMETERPSDGKPSYLSCLVRENATVGNDQMPWSETLRMCADEFDRAALLRARDAAALSAIARAAYFAAVEATCEERDGRTPGTKHREHLATVVKTYSHGAIRLDLHAAEGDGVYLGELRPVLSELQAWTRNYAGAPPEGKVRQILADWEDGRKGQRARLPLSGHGREARSEWDASKTASAVPINYRWHLIARFLKDLVA